MHGLASAARAELWDILGRTKEKLKQRTGFSDLLLADRKNSKRAWMGFAILFAHCVLLKN